VIIVSYGGYASPGSLQRRQKRDQVAQLLRPRFFLIKPINEHLSPIVMKSCIACHGSPGI